MHNNKKNSKKYSHGDGLTNGEGLKNIDLLSEKGEGSLIEDGVLLFHPENIKLGRDVYIGHQTILKAYYKNKLIIGDGTWIGQQCFLHSAGGITIGKSVGIGPGVKILTSNHIEENIDDPIINQELNFNEVVIEDNVDIGINSVLLPGITIGRGTQVGAGSIVTKSLASNSVFVGNPAKFLRKRKEQNIASDKGDSTKYNNLIFIGSKSLGLEILNKIIDLNKNAVKAIVTIDDQKDSRTCFSDFKSLAKLHNLPLEIVKKNKDLDHIIDDYNPDICFVANYYYIIDKNLLSKVSGGFFGFHFSLLPKYRGFAPLVWAVINGDKESGLSLFQFGEDMDSGNIIDQKKFSIEKEDDISDLIVKATNLSLLSLEESFDLILSGKSEGYSQDNSNATYTTRRVPEDGLINWQESSSKLFNFIRAQTSPYPGAFTYLNGAKIYILKSITVEKKSLSQPGKVVHKEGNTVEVSCGQGTIKIHKIRINNKEESRVGDFFKVGDILGYNK